MLPTSLRKQQTKATGADRRGPATKQRDEKSGEKIQDANDKDFILFLFF